MAVDISKPADQVYEDAKKEVAAAFPDEAKKTEAANKIQSGLGEEDAKRKAYEDVKTLADTIRNIRVKFTDVAATLVKFDAEKFKDKQGNVITLGPQWSPYIRQFDDTLQFSLETAVNAVTMMKSINAVLGDVMPPDGKDLKAELEQFMRILDQKEKDSAGMADKFDKLSKDVGSFVVIIDKALEDAAAAIKDQLDKAKAKIVDLQKQLTEINEKIQALGKAIVGEIVATGTAVAAAVATLNPATVVAVLTSVVSLISSAVALKKAFDERTRITRGLEDATREVAELNARAELLKKYKTELDKTKVVVSDISSQIGTIANIWRTINLDMRALNEQLKTALGSNGDAQLTKFFLKKLETARELYKHLIFILETYVEQTRSA